MATVDVTRTMERSCFVVVKVRETVKRMQRRVKKASHPFLLPPWSAIAPRMGPKMAINREAVPLMPPQRAPPMVGFSVRFWVKYTAKINDWIIAEKALFAQSYKAHERRC